MTEADLITAASHYRKARERGVGPAWVFCPGCESFWCRIHGTHAHDCACPALDERDDDPDPYSEGGPPMTDEEILRVSGLGPGGRMTHFHHERRTEETTMDDDLKIEAKDEAIGETGLTILALASKREMVDYAWRATSHAATPRQKDRIALLRKAFQVCIETTPPIGLTEVSTASFAAQLLRESLGDDEPQILALAVKDLAEALAAVEAYLCATA